MADQVTLNRIQQLHPSVRAEAQHIYLAQIVPALTGRAICRFSYTIRTFEEQNILYSYGRTKLYDAKGNKLGVVTNAKGGQSLHNYGLALDIALIKDTNGDGTYETSSWEYTVDFDKDGTADWMEIVKIFKRSGWEWGGDWKFKDRPHFQKTFGHSWKTLLAKYKASQFIPGTNYVMI